MGTNVSDEYTASIFRVFNYEYTKDTNTRCRSPKNKSLQFTVVKTSDITYVLGVQSQNHCIKMFILSFVR
jgi:hypothetical protein